MCSSDVSLVHIISYHTSERCVGKGIYHERRACFDVFSTFLTFEENIAKAGYDSTHQLGVTCMST